MPEVDAVVVGLAAGAQICIATDLVEGSDTGRGIRFTVQRGPRCLPAFVVRYEGRVYAYLNQCAHVPMELDWSPGVFFDTEGLALMCATHGALYTPETGRCVAGPCMGASLISVAVAERDGGVFLL